MGKVTIRDVAAAAGVSISAVSYILNGSTKKKYSEATVKAVRRAAEKLQYTPNSFARSMRTQRANAIGIVSFFERSARDVAPMLRSVTEAAAAVGSAAVLCIGKDDFSYI
ncbi:MAG: LacI family DNA-binding transcriptional regulator, partial [Clostridia bacterium]|nr:LacI family DNA-binding transcriptional regulator [Clostridia bacterium]